MRVLVADLHALIRQGISVLLKEDPGVQIVAEAGNSREMLNYAAIARPDIVMMGAWLAEGSGLAAVARLHREHPEVKIIIFSIRSDEEYIDHALRAGVTGYLGKEATLPELQTAIKRVAKGETYFSPPLSRLTPKAPRGHKQQSSTLTRLTPRQREILRLIAEGSSTKEIAFLLKVSIKTVETHRAHLMERLNIYNVPGLVRFAMRTGLISWET